MGGLIGNILANAAAGGVEGAGEGVAKEGELAWKDEHERMKQEATATREARNIALQGGEARMTEAAKPVHVAPGATVQRPGQPDFQAPSAPEKSLTFEQVDKLKAEAEYLRSHARAQDREKPAKEPKPTFPKLVKSQSADGSEAWMDQNVPGAVGTIVPPVEGKPGEKNWVFPNKPAIAGKPASMVWSVDGVTMDSGEYRRRFYGDANPVSGRDGVQPSGAPSAPQQADPLGLRASLPKATQSPTQQPPSGIVGSNSAPKALAVEPFLTRTRGGFMFQASPRSSEIAKQLNGRSFRTAQEAQDAYDALMNPTG